VIAAVRNQTKAEGVFGSLVTADKPAAPGNGLLEVKSGVDVTDTSTLTPELFKDVSHVSAIFNHWTSIQALHTSDS